MNKTVTYRHADTICVIEYTYAGGLWYAEMEQAILEQLLRSNGYE